jgi:hypothetical protein
MASLNVITILPLTGALVPSGVTPVTVGRVISAVAGKVMVTIPESAALVTLVAHV